MFPRNLTAPLVAALSDTPVVLLQGARQTGKSTLVRALAEGPHPAKYLSLDEATILGAATSDPQGFIDRLTEPVILDEVQRAPELMLAIKRAVDLDRAPGRFLLTGSAEVLPLPRLADSLAGRMEIATLWPLSQGEIEGRREEFIDTVFADRRPVAEARPSEPKIWQRVLAGGYPEPLTRADPQRKSGWYEAYLTTLLQRDVRDFASIEGLTELPRLLALLATRAGGLVNFSELGRDSGLALTTLKRYMALLERTFLLIRLPPWSSNLGKRLVKAPKIYLNDSGLAAHLLGVPAQENVAPPREAGRLLETFVATELTKALAWSRTRPSLFHLRTQTRVEVDFVLEARNGDLVGVEVKASSSVGTKDFQGLSWLRESVGARFRAGVVLYLGDTLLPFGPDLWACPVTALWQPARKT